MRTILLAVGLALAGSAASVGAQDDAAHTLMDMTVWAVPPDAQGHCLMLDAGTVTISVVRATGPEQPALYTFQGYRGLDQGAADAMVPVTGVPQQIVRAVSGGLYCYSVQNITPVPPGAGLSALSNLGTNVAVRLSFTPSVH